MFGCFGPESWRAFLAHTLPAQTAMMSRGHGPFLWMMSSAFGAGRLWGWPADRALLFQAPFGVFGAFLAWSVSGFRAARARDRAAGTVYRAGSVGGDARVIVIGLLAWGGFAGFLHAWLIGVKPFG